MEAFETEALRVLRCEAWRAGPLAEALARLAVRAACGAEFEVQRAALSELMARFDAVARDGLAIQERIAPGWFAVAEQRVWLGSVSPIEASCSCADYRKASLGACRHVIAVLCQLERLPQAARFERPVVRWDPIRPLSGTGDWVERLACCDARVLDAADRAAVIAKLRQANTFERFLEPAIAGLVEREQTACAHVDPAVVVHGLASLSAPLFEFQRAGVVRFFETGRLLLGDDMGLGKTAQAIAIGHVLVHARAVERVAVIVPSPLKWQWAHEWSRFAPEAPRVVDGSPAERRAMYRGAGILILSYEQLRRDTAELHDWQPELVILDEAQRIKNAPTQTARAVKRLAPRWRLALSGTPLENRLEELASIVEWIDDMALEPRWRLLPWHAVRVDGGREVVGMRDLGTLRERLAGCFMRRVRADVLQQLPARRDSTIPVPLTPEQQRVHQRFDVRVAALLEQARRRAVTPEEHLELMRLLTSQRMICDGLALKSFEDLWPSLRLEPATPQRVAALFAPKLDALAELLGSIAIQQQRKVVVFSQWRRMLQLAEWATRPLLDAGDARAVYFSGEESQQRRIANLVRFHDRADVRVLWATDAGAVGLNLQRAASCCINLDLPWNPAVLEQRIGRIYRLGQTEPVDVYNLVGIGGIEERIAHLIADKRTLFAELFDGTGDAVAFGNAVAAVAGGGRDARAA